MLPTKIYILPQIVLSFMLPNPCGNNVEFWNLTAQVESLSFTLFNVYKKWSKRHILKKYWMMHLSSVLFFQSRPIKVDNAHHVFVLQQKNTWNLIMCQRDDKKSGNTASTIKSGFRVFQSLRFKMGLKGKGLWSLSSVAEIPGSSPVKESQCIWEAK